MKKQYSILTLLMVFVAFSTSAQTRYLDPIYTDAEIEVTTDVDYGTNVDFLTSTTTNQLNVGRDMLEIGTALQTGQSIPAKFFDPRDASTDIKVTTVKMDVYKPMTSVDATTDRPVIVYLHTGNFLPPRINGSPNGSKGDSSAIVLCTEWAKRGYVAVAVNYRLGWNPLATEADVRRGQLLNAVYRAIHDTKEAVRNIKENASTYGIDPTKVVLYGEGTGAYVALAYETLDKNEEMELQKFRAAGTGPSYINRVIVGEIDGSGGALNLYRPTTTSTEVTAIVTAGGALADTSWLEAGDAPMISFHTVRDAFAPFSEGTVVVPTTNEDVVDVQGGNLYVQKAVALGNNDAILNIEANDPYTTAARALYGKEVDYIYPAPFNKITINTDVEGLYPVLLPVADDVLNNQASPWQWWNPTSDDALHEVGPAGSGFTAHMNSIQSNPDMSPEKGRTYIDTIMGYMCPRIALINGDIELSQLSVANTLPSTAVTLYPNPTQGNVTVKVENTYNVLDVAILDLTGKVVMKGESTNNQTVNIASLKDGYYTVRISTEAGTVSQKLMKF